ncbi:amino acid/amide ABC transporter ATP-binding protein 2 (HAAT family) [Actinomadura hallensis]|uniref:Amino acid/amide ABC transporter ATP-binding protein 2 (HAAT family) n=1 Tax=Actinomadura hallensis TaxID=337895 RepID=A0A543ICM9_9ACTN|nr:ABC transporter ATP-binding protein [Actinomadura hallensis]TQM68348.1 amino acid/amide ABC transporter ATP-binding protein 2 (HAAT family) [Actinomadura hallensis]
MSGDATRREAKGLDAPDASGGPPVLRTTGLSAGYGAAGNAVTDLNLRVSEGQVVSLLGPNGAGKTTVMRAVSGLLGLHRGRVTCGRVELFGRDVTGARPSQRVRAGLAQCLEGRMVFPGLTVAENLASGGHVRRYRGAALTEARDEVLALLPRLRDLLDRKAGYLSGGEQQMLAIARALMSRPKLLLMDEPSLGLAPRIVEQVRDVIVSINERGTSILLVEQNARMALSISGYAYLLEGGRICAEGTPEALEQDNDIAAAYLGVGAAPVTPRGAGS